MKWESYIASQPEDDRTALERFMANRFRTTIKLPPFEFDLTLLGTLRIRGHLKRRSHYLAVTLYPDGDALKQFANVHLELYLFTGEIIGGWQRDLRISYRPAPIEDAGWTTSEGWPEQHLRRIQKTWRWQ